jgi:hypothetical protein
MTIDWSIITDWVQAIGSVAAVWAAFAIFSRQNREHNAREQAAADAKIIAVRTVLARSHKAVDRAHHKLARTAKVTFAPGNIGATEKDLDECVDLLSGVPLFDLPNTDLVDRVMDARYWLNTARRRTDKIRAALEAGTAPKRDLYDDPLDHLARAADF